ncbi:DUF6069 family protein [Streptosporangium subroseum]|uniref:DUF6069 family protein n=1 Tax=Streptosporangium subroseum TaxID=106412 RepID=UPI0034397893
MTAPSQTPQSVTTNTSARRVRALAVGGAVLATSLLWLAAQVLDIDLRVDQPGDGQPPVTVGLPLVIGVTLVLSLLGWGSLAVLERYIRRARTIWTVLAIAVLALSFVPILGVEATSSTKTVLALMHLAVAAVLIPMLRRSAPTAHGATT